MSSEEAALRGLLEEAFGLIALAQVTDDAPTEIRESLHNWIVKTHSMLCDNHPEVKVEVLRMYSASQN